MLPRTVLSAACRPVSVYLSACSVYVLCCTRCQTRVKKKLCKGVLHKSQFICAQVDIFISAYHSYQYTLSFPFVNLYLYTHYSKNEIERNSLHSCALFDIERNIPGNGKRVDYRPFCHGVSRTTFCVGVCVKVVKLRSPPPAPPHTHTRV